MGGRGGGKGALLTGDIIQVVADRKHVSFMYSYPNYVPLSASAVERIVRAVEPFEYDRVYGAFWDTVIEQDGKAAVERSAERYLRAIREAQPCREGATMISDETARPIDPQARIGHVHLKVSDLERACGSTAASSASRSPVPLR